MNNLNFRKDTEQNLNRIHKNLPDTSSMAKSTIQTSWLVRFSIDEVLHKLRQPHSYIQAYVMMNISMQKFAAVAMMKLKQGKCKVKGKTCASSSWRIYTSILVHVQVQAHLLELATLNACCCCWLVDKSCAPPNGEQSDIDADTLLLFGE